jgi:sulfite reductase (ferredoxin)
VGRARDKYTLFLGGRAIGDRISFMYKDMVPAEEVVTTLTPVFVYFKQARQNGESLGEFCQRVGQADLLAFAEKHAAALVS